MARGDGKNREEKAEVRRVQPFEPDKILTALERHKVDFVVIGAYAAVLQGWVDPTRDIDITPDRDHGNLVRLAEALLEIDAQVISEDGELDPGWPIDDQHLRILGTTSISTRHGDIDVVNNPSATEGYADLSRSSESFWLSIGESKIKVAQLQRVVNSKREADRPKDRLALPELERLLDEKDKS